MMNRLHAELERMAEEGGVLGEVWFGRTDAGYVMRHTLDAGVEGLQVYEMAEAALELAKYSTEGRYRPLKSAPGLARGWMLVLPGVSALAQALDFFYPAMWGTWLAWREGAARLVSLRETVNRQTGMYRVTGKITDAQADALVGTVCAPGCCRKVVLWQIDADRAITTLPPEKLVPSGEAGVVPLLCEEPCNILVAAAREVVKKAESAPIAPAPNA